MRISDWSSDVCSSDLFSQELRYQTKLDLPVNFLVGAYYQHSSYQNLNSANVFPMAVQGAPFTFEKEARQKGRTWSVFGELQVKLAEDLQLDQIGRASCRERVCQYV